jgi:hypothetical protein
MANYWHKLGERGVRVQQARFPHLPPVLCCVCGAVLQVSSASPLALG